MKKPTIERVDVTGVKAKRVIPVVYGSDICKVTYQTVDLWNADPNCEHELDNNCWSGIRCRLCEGWYCL